MSKGYLNTVWYDLTSMEETEGIRDRCNAEFIEAELGKLFPDEKIKITEAYVHECGKYNNLTRKSMPLFLKGVTKCINLPHFCFVRLDRETETGITEHIIVWSPLKWNDRFLGTAGGGTQTGGEEHIKQSDNATRGANLTTAVRNGFSAATTDAGNAANWARDMNAEELQWDRIRNWNYLSTHWMTLIGKSVTEILHQRKIRFSYMTGGSGGGRQCLAEAQRYPEDYDGIWASCPAINWSRISLAAHWAIAVMNSYKNVLTIPKLEAFRDTLVSKYDKEEEFYYHITEEKANAYGAVGKKTKAGVITEPDAKVMQKIWDGPTDENGEKISWFFYPGMRFWNKHNLPIAAMIYMKKDGKKIPLPFSLFADYGKWLMGSGFSSEEINLEGFMELFHAASKFGEYENDNPDLTKFYERGGKLVIDHGTADPLISPKGTLHYYETVKGFFQDDNKVDTFFKVFLTPGDGHGNCSADLPGIPYTETMRLLTAWVEEGAAPKMAKTMQVMQISKKLRKTGNVNVLEM